jgi:hypothetical protein
MGSPVFARGPLMRRIAMIFGLILILLGGRDLYSGESAKIACEARVTDFQLYAMRDYFQGGREDVFSAAILELESSEYKGKRVHIYGGDEMPAFMKKKGARILFRISRDDLNLALEGKAQLFVGGLENLAEKGKAETEAKRKE